MTEEAQKLYSRYLELMASLSISENDIDYSVLQKHRHYLSYMSQVENSAITIFDLYKKEHVFASYNFNNLFGYDMKELEEGGNEFFNSRVHPEDFIDLLRCSIRLFEFLLATPKERRSQMKAINEYRVLNSKNQYVRVIEQHQSLELDRKGNLWLTLGIIDMSPNQDGSTAVRSQIVDFKTGELIRLPDEKKMRTDPVILSLRERQVLEMVKEGLLSKEISERLFISVHTVNTHRQRILEKLNANNSQEAIRYATDLGFFG